MILKNVTNGFKNALRKHANEFHEHGMVAYNVRFDYRGTFYIARENPDTGLYDIWYTPYTGAYENSVIAKDVEI